MLTEPEETDPVQNFIYGRERDFKENRHLEKMKRWGEACGGGPPVEPITAAQVTACR